MEDPGGGWGEFSKFEICRRKKLLSPTWIEVWIQSATAFFGAGANDANYAKISGVGDASDAMANPCCFTRCSAFCRPALLQSRLVVVCFRPRFGPLRVLSPRFGPPG